MCAPLAAIGPIVGLAGSVVGAMGDGQEADAQAAARERQAQVREINAIVAREDGVAKVDAKGDEHEAVIASQEVNAAANGVVAEGGSFDKIQMASYKNKYLDEDELLRQADAEATNHENLAKSDRAAASDIRKSGKVKAFSTILGGVASASKGLATQIA